MSDESSEPETGTEHVETPAGTEVDSPVPAPDSGADDGGEPADAE